MVKGGGNTSNRQCQKGYDDLQCWNGSALTLDRYGDEQNGDSSGQCWVSHARRLAIKGQTALSMATTTLVHVGQGVTI